MKRLIVILALVLGACSADKPAEPKLSVLVEVAIPGQPPASTHGPDDLPPKPEGLAAGLAPETAWPCEGTGTEGRRVQFVYAHAGGPTLTASQRQTFEGVARRIEGTFLTSAQKTGGQRLVRFVTSPTCALSIIDLPVSSAALSSFDSIIAEMRTAGLNRTDRIYHAWTEASTYCGIGTIYRDDRATGNYNDVAAQYSRSDRGCWDYAEAHEITHNLGGVQDSAPHATGGLHCRDESDLMCYADGGPNGQMIQPYLCPDFADEGRLDCGNDDYFAATPLPGSYLASHWNTADAAALVRSTTATTAPPPSSTTSTVPPSTTSTTIGTVQTTTTLTVSSSIRSGVAFTASATVTGRCTLDGTVSFYVGGKLMSRQVLASGTASVSLTITGGAARPTIRSDYSGSSTCAASSDSARPRLR